jgi:ribose transport system substrate-binding protein
MTVKNIQAIKESFVRFVLAAVISAAILLPLLSQEKLRIAVIPKSNAALFWKSIHAGAKLGSVALGNVEVLWKVPLEESTLSQISAVEQCIEDGVSAIILAPLEKDSLAVPVAAAMKKKIPVLIFDSALKGTEGRDYIGFVGIDNKKAGRLAGEHMVALLGRKGKVVVLRVSANQASILDREKGFLEVMARHKGIGVMEKSLTLGATADDAVNESLAMAGNLEEADGIFCSYEQSTIAMLCALRKLGLAGKASFIGFDTPPDAVDALQKGEISALVAQDPARVGYLSVKAAADYLRGKKIETVIDAGVQVVTRENLNSTEVQKILAVPSITE